MIKNILSDYGIYDINGNIEEKTVKIKNKYKLDIYSSLFSNIRNVYYINNKCNDFEFKDINWNLEYVEVSYFSGKFTYKRLDYSFLDKMKNRLLS